MNRFRQQNEPLQSDPTPRSRPLRSFSHTSPHPNSQRAKRPSRYKTYLLFLGLAGIVLLAAALGISYFTAKDAVSPVSQMSPTFSSYSKPIKVPELLDAHLDVLGGRKALQDMRSVRYEGTVKFTSGQSDFQMLILTPDKGMLVTNPGQADWQKLMLNGDIAWRVIERQDGARAVERLGEQSMKSLQWSLRVHNTLRGFALEGQYAGLAVQEIEYMDKPCYEFTKTMSDGSEFLAILEKETLYLLKMTETLRVGEEQDVFTILYDDHRMVSGVVEPYKTTLYKDGNLDNEVEIRSIQINAGVISSLFKVPDELLN